MLWCIFLNSAMNSDCSINQHAGEYGLIIWGDGGALVLNIPVTIEHS